MPKNIPKGKTVLIGVLKTKNDRHILFKERWYRIPLEFLPKRAFGYTAFYQPAIFGKRGKRIEYYAKVSSKSVHQRIELFPKEANHPRAHDDYLKIKFAKIEKLPRAIKNIIPRRVSFGFTTMKKLLSSRDILELYGVPKTEQIVENLLKRLSVKYLPQFPVSIKSKRFRIDLAIFSKNGRLAIECDNRKAHTGKLQKSKDKIKDSYLRRAGWRVIRLKERDIIENPNACARKIGRVLSTNED